MGVTVSDMGYGVDTEAGTSAPRIRASRSRKASPMHDPLDLGDATDATDRAKYKATLTAAKTSKAAFVASFTAQWGSTAAGVVSGWTTAEQDALWATAKETAAVFGL